MFDRRTRFLVLLVQTHLATKADVYLSAVGNRRAGVVAMVVSDQCARDVRAALEIANPNTRAVGGRPPFRRPPRSGARFHQRLSVPLFFCRLSFPISGVHWTARISCRRNHARL